jgi:hypothetical protein
MALPLTRAQQPPQQPEGVEVQTRGPIHEAFAEPVDGQPAPTHIVNREPPAPIQEQPPDQRPEGEHVQWIGGYWAWDDARNDYLWVSGFWRTPPPGRTWVPGSWRTANGGFQWVSGYWAPEQKTEQQYLPPPPASVESGPTIPAPSQSHVYVPGSWYYNSDHYVWRPGVWVEYRPGWVWIPAHYRWTPAGYVFIEGYWDFPLRERGLLFAPVYISPVVAYRPGWYYSPTFVVYDNSLYGALFVRTGSTHYYFGDYFEARYTSIGYHSWFSVSFGRSYSYDPLFSYYRFTYRHDPYWEPAMREVYVARYAGDLPRPPVSLSVSINIGNTGPTVINNPTIVNKYTYINKSTTIVNVTNITNVNNTVTNINQVNNTNNTINNVKMTTVTPAAKQQFVQNNQQIQNVAKQRQQTENQLVSSGQVPKKAGDPPRSTQLNTVKPAGSTTTTTPSRQNTSTQSPSTGPTPHLNGNTVNPALSGNNPPKPPLGTPPNLTAPTSPNAPKPGTTSQPPYNGSAMPNNTLNGNNGAHPPATGISPPPSSSPFGPGTPGQTKTGTNPNGTSPNGTPAHQTEKDKKKDKKKEEGH